MTASDFLPDFNFFAENRFWSEKECRQLREISKTSTVEEAGVYLQGSRKVDQGIRRTKRILLDPSLSAEIQESLLSIKPHLEEHFQMKLNGLQAFQFLQYHPGDYFRTHQDEGNPASDSTRKISIILFLNSQSSDTGFQGGDIVFYQDSEHSLADQGLHLSAEEGLLLAFSSYMLHKVTEVTSGVRYSIVSWFF